MLELLVGSIGDSVLEQRLRPTPSLPPSLSPPHLPLLTLSLQGRVPELRWAAAFSLLTRARRREEQNLGPPGEWPLRAEAAEDDVVIEDFEEDSEAEGSGGEYDIRELRARKLALARKIAEQQRRREKIQAVLEDQTQMRQMELEIRPLFLVPDTNGFIDHLGSLVRLLESRKYILVVPLIVINELDGLAKGQETERRAGGYARVVQEKARKSIEFLERRFESRDSCLRALTSRGNELESIAFRSEDITGQQGNNDDLILSCCLHYCKDKAKDFMPPNKDEPIRLLREVVLLTDDRNLRVKALTRNVPVRDISAFLKWAQVG